jgi:hypothetical protein
MPFREKKLFFQDHMKHTNTISGRMQSFSTLNKVVYMGTTGL